MTSGGTDSHPRCDVCGADGARPLFHATDHREGLGGTFALVACGGCGLVRTEPRPDDLGAWYPQTYANHAERMSLTVRGTLAGLRYCASPTRRDRLAGVIGRLIPNAEIGQRLPPGSRALDVGAGNGGAVAALRMAGHDARGVEPSEHAVSVAHEAGIATVLQGTLEHTALPEGEWDLIRFTHVLEHIESPVATLTRARKLLAPDGRIVILVPNFNGAGRRLFGGAWDGLEVPRHLHHFTRRTLAGALTAAGLRVSTMRTAALLGVIPASLDAFTAGAVRQRGWGGNLAVRAAFYPLDLALAAVGLGEGIVAVAHLAGGAAT